MKIDPTSEVTSGGVVIPDSAKEKPLSGTVVRVGSGKQNDEGEIEPCKVKKTQNMLVLGSLLCSSIFQSVHLKFISALDQHCSICNWFKT